MKRERPRRDATSGASSSTSDDPGEHVASVTKRLRMRPSEARSLEELARVRGRTESDILRDGLELVKLQEKRLKLLDDLMAYGEGLDAEPGRFEMR